MIATTGNIRTNRATAAPDGLRAVRVSRMEHIQEHHKFQSKWLNEAYAAAAVGWDVTKSHRMRRRFGNLTGLLASADRHLDRPTLQTLREFCRAHDRQTPLWGGILDRACDNIVGERLDFICETGNPDANKAVQDYIRRKMEAKYADATGQRDLTEITRDTIRSAWNDGDILHAKRSDGSMLTFEADQVDDPSMSYGLDSDKSDKKDETNRLVLGVEMDNVGRHVAYHVRQRFSDGSSGQVKQSSSKRVEVEDCFFPAYRTRFGQTRGIPFLARCLGFADRFFEYIDCESNTALANSMLVWKILRDASKSGNATYPDSGITIDGEDDNDDTLSAFKKVQKAEWGQILDFSNEPGVDAEMMAAERPGSNFDPYITMCCRLIGVGVGYPLELVMLNFTKGNFSGSRLALNEARRSFRAWQGWLGRHFVMGWYRWQISRGIAAGEFDAFLKPEINLYSARPDWPRWEYIEPKKEREADLVGIISQTVSPQECIRNRGEDPAKVQKEIEDWKKWSDKTDLGYPTGKTTVNINSDNDEPSRKDNEDDE